VNFDRPQSLGTHFYYATARAVYTADDFTITSISGYLHERDWNRGDVDGTSIDMFYEVNPLVRDSASEEFRVQSTTDTPLQWTAGFLLDRERGNREQHTLAGFQNPFGLPEGFDVSSDGSSSEAQNNSYAVFGDLTWHATDALTLIAGARFSYDEASTIVFNSQPPHTLVGASSANFHDFSPRFSGEYQIADRLNAYVTVSKGYKSGGVQVNPQLNLSSYQPETVWNYEGGIKGEFLDRRIRTNLSVFYMDWTNLQVGYAVGQTNGKTVTFLDGISNAATARSYGGEAEVDAQVTSNFSVSATAGYINAKFINYANAFVEGANLNLSGATIPNSPRWTLNSSAEYRIPFTEFADDGEGFVRVEWFYRGANAPNIDSVVYSGFPWKVPSYNQWNLRAGYDSHALSLIAYIENLSGDQYYLNSYEKAFAGGLYVQPAYQNFGFKATYRY
jgi:iron complex outermembrane receptor protein